MLKCAQCGETEAGKTSCVPCGFAPQTTEDDPPQSDPAVDAIEDDGEIDLGDGRVEWRTPWVVVRGRGRIPVRPVDVRGYTRLGRCMHCRSHHRAEWVALRQALINADPGELERFLDHERYAAVRSWLLGMAADLRRRRKDARAQLDAEQGTVATATVTRQPAAVDADRGAQPSAEAGTRSQPGRRPYRITGLTPEETYRRCEEVRRLHDTPSPIEGLTFEQIAQQYTGRDGSSSESQVREWYRWIVEDLIKPPPGWV